MNQAMSIDEWKQQLMIDYAVTMEEIEAYIDIFPMRRLWVNFACKRRSEGWSHSQVLDYLKFVKDDQND